MFKVFSIAFVLLFLEIFGFKEFVLYMHPSEFLKIIVLIPFIGIASITVWCPIAIGICGGPDDF